MREERYYLIDIIRGIAILNMVLYHAMWDLVNIFYIEIPFFESSFSFYWQQLICTSFIFIAGLSYQFSKDNLKRICQNILFGFLITVVTVFFVKDSAIYFGILTLIGSCGLFVYILKNKLLKINGYVGFFVSILMFFMTKNINKGYIGVFEWQLIEIPEIFYRNILTAYFGFPSKNFVSADYFPLMPWIFIFLSGFYFYNILNKKNELIIFTQHRQKFFEMIGRNSLKIYLLHQVIIYIFLVLLFKLL